MDLPRLIINGNKRLDGSIKIGGAKNSALPILTSSIICNGESVIHNCPDLTDVSATMKILEYLGCKLKRQAGTITVDSRGLCENEIPEELMREMRSSIVFLGALLSRFNEAKLSLPGGCEIGLRPIDLHLKALRQMGVIIEESHGFLNCRVENRLKGARISLSFPSVGATENVILAAVTADGQTVINNAAREPEITDLANYLNACGADIRGAGEGVVVINPVNKLEAASHRVIPDRIVALTFICAAAITGGDILIEEVIPGHMSHVLDIFEDSGCRITASKGSLRVKAPERLKSVKLIRTMPYPGFPTDAQAPVMAALCKACGTSVFVENIFESRYNHISELNRLGANISTESRTAIVRGVPELYGAKVEASDLRATAALIVAALGAVGRSEIQELKYLDRGYENIDVGLTQLGADVFRTEK